MADWDGTEPYVNWLIRNQNSWQPAAPAPAPAPAPSGPPLSGDATYLAFQRALGNEQDVATRNAQDQSDTIDRSTALRLPQIAQAGTYARQGISGRMEARGILRSGETEQNIARQRQSEADQTAGVYDTAAQQKAAIQQALAGQIAGYGTRTAEANLGAASRQQAGSDTAAIEKALADGMAGINSSPVDYSSLFGLPPAPAPPPPPVAPVPVPALGGGGAFGGTGASGSWGAAPSPPPKKRSGRAV